MKKVLLWGIWLMTLGSCSKDNVDVIPNVRFNGEIDLNHPLYVGRNPFIVERAINGQRFGFNGVVVFTAVPNSIYYAFDLMCTHQHDTPGYYYTVNKPSGSGFMVCPECGSKFEILSEYGSVVEGPAQWALKRYQTDVRAGNYLRIWN